MEGHCLLSNSLHEVPSLFFSLRQKKYFMTLLIRFLVKYYFCNRSISAAVPLWVRLKQLFFFHSRWFILGKYFPIRPSESVHVLMGVGLGHQNNHEVFFHRKSVRLVLGEDCPPLGEILNQERSGAGVQTCRLGCLFSQVWSSFAR